LRVVFRGPGRHAEATIDRGSGALGLVTETHGLTGRLTDLHRGKAAGAAWGAVIDAVSILIVLISLTGLILWTSLKRRRLLGLLALAAGLAVSLGIYAIYVP
jgi:hypothetical protein